MASYPTSPHELTAELLASLVTDAGHSWGSAIRGVTVAAVADAGETAQTVRVLLRYAEGAAGGPPSMIAKMAAALPEVRTFFGGAGIYRREVRFYAELSERAGVPVPGPYFAAHDQDSGTFLLLLEDLGAGRVGSLARPSIDDVSTALSSIAKMHASWWDSEELLGSRWLSPPSDHAPARSAMNERARSAVAGEGGIPLPEPWRSRAANALSGILDAPDRIWGALSDLPQTLIHGDFHLQNVFFPSGLGGEFAVFDWQSVHRGIAGQDFAEMIVLGLSSAERRLMVPGLLERQRDEFARHGVALDAREVEQQYRLGVAANAVSILGRIPALDPRSALRPDPETGVTFVEMLTERLVEALEDIDANSLLS